MRTLALALLLVVAAASPAAAADETTFGAAISPVPLIIENWRDPAISVENRGYVPIRIVFEVEGDEGYALEQAAVTLAAHGDRVTVPFVSFGQGNATIRAIATNAESGMDAARIILETTARHRTLLDQLSVSWLVPGILAGLTTLLVLVRLLAQAHRMRRQPSGNS